MKTKAGTLTGLVWLMFFLTGCGPSPAQRTAAPTTSLTPTFTLQPSPTQSPTASPSPQPAQQVYLDPDGWYSVSFPAAWKKSVSSTYVGSDGFFETGYLPQFGLMHNRMSVCEWLANIQTKNLYTIWWLGYRCQLRPRPNVSQTLIWEIITNPSADSAHRYLYIKADRDHIELIASSLTWLRKVDEKATPDFSKDALRAEDIKFWNSTSALPANFSLKEYALKFANPSHVLLDVVPKELLPTQSSPGITSIPETMERVNQSFAKYGYQLKREEDIDYLYDLYQNDKLVLQNIYKLPKINVFPTSDGDKLIFFINTLIDRKKTQIEDGNELTYLVQDQKISVWEKRNMTYASWTSDWSPILVENKPLFLEMGAGVTLQVRDAQREPISSFATYIAASVPLKQFRSWQNHWILGVSEFTVEDGEILNEKYNFEEVFNWGVVKDKPFYFFRKGPQVGFSYNGKFFSTYYQEVFHGGCCMLGLNNPHTYTNPIRFFGKRDGTWYYVVLKIW